VCGCTRAWVRERDKEIEKDEGERKGRGREGERETVHDAFNFLCQINFFFMLAGVKKIIVFTLNLLIFTLELLFVTLEGAA
jgi:hypothetical protein